MIELVELMISGVVMISVVAMGIMGILGALMMLSMDIDKLVSNLDEVEPEELEKDTEEEKRNSEKIN